MGAAVSQSHASRKRKAPMTEEQPISKRLMQRTHTHSSFDQDSRKPLGKHDGHGKRASSHVTHDDINTFLENRETSGPQCPRYQVPNKVTACADRLPADMKIFGQIDTVGRKSPIKFGQSAEQLGKIDSQKQAGSPRSHTEGTFSKKRKHDDEEAVGSSTKKLRCLIADESPPAPPRSLARLNANIAGICAPSSKQGISDAHTKAKPPEPPPTATEIIAKVPSEGIHIADFVDLFSCRIGEQELRDEFCQLVRQNSAVNPIKNVLFPLGTDIGIKDDVASGIT